MGAGQRNKRKGMLETQLHRLALYLGFNQAVWRIFLHCRCQNPKTTQEPSSHYPARLMTLNVQIIFSYVEYFGTWEQQPLSICRHCSSILALSAVLS